MGDPAQTDLYAVLGADPSDSAQQLRRRYQRLLLQVHPDRLSSSSSSSSSSGGSSRFLEVEAAWRILGDESLRRSYDSERRAAALTQGGPVDSTVRLQDMSFSQGDGVFSCECRCGGSFSVSEQELEEQQEEEEAEAAHGSVHGSVLVGCDTCSLSVMVTWSPDRKTGSSSSSSSSSSGSSSS